MDCHGEKEIMAAVPRGVANGQGCGNAWEEQYQAVIELVAGLCRDVSEIDRVAAGLKSGLRHARGVVACFSRPDRVNLAAESPSPAGVCFHGWNEAWRVVVGECGGLRGRVRDGGAGAGRKIVRLPDRANSNLPAWADVSRGFDKVVSTADGQSLYTLYKRERDGAMMAEMPKGYEGQRHFFAMTVATGQEYAGLQANNMWCIEAAWSGSAAADRTQHGHEVDGRRGEQAEREERLHGSGVA
jgi:hypothetical protein